MKMAHHTDRLFARLRREQIGLPPYMLENAHVIFSHLNEIKTEANRYNKEAKRNDLATINQCDRCDRSLGKVRKEVNASIEGVADLILDLSRLYQKELFARQKEEERRKRKDPCNCA